jgi:hypothetical protein
VRYFALAILALTLAVAGLQMIAEDGSARAHPPSAAEAE